jgi:hypothetical protein
VLRNVFYISAFFYLTSCNNTERNFDQKFIVYKSDTRTKDIGFKPTTNQINKANTKLLNYLDTKSKNNQTVFKNSLEGKVPLQNQLKYYKRRYFGQINIGGEQIIKIEFVFVRCGGQDEWKKIEYTNVQTKDCWWSVIYNIDKDQILDLK